MRFFKYLPFVFLLYSGCQSADPTYFMIKIETDGIDFKNGQQVKIAIQNYSDEEVYINICEDMNEIFFLEKKNIAGEWDTAYVSSCSNIFDRRAHYKPIESQTIHKLTLPINIDTAKVDSIISGVYRFKFNIVANGTELEKAFSVSNSINVSEPELYNIEITTGKTKYQIGEFANFRIKNLSNEGINLTICADQESFYYVEKKTGGTWNVVYTGQCRPDVNKESFYIGSKAFYPNNIFPGTALIDIDTSLTDTISGVYRLRFDITGEKGSSIEERYKVTNSFEIE